MDARISEMTNSSRRWRQRPPGSNWGDFGEDDQIGRMNLITPEIRKAAIQEVRLGMTFCLSLPLDYPGGTVLSELRKPPRLMASQDLAGTEYYNLPVGIGTDTPLGVASDDAVMLHTQYSTQWDSLAHWGTWFDADGDGREEIVYYNGFRGGEHVLARDGDKPPEARALGIETLAATGVQGRAVVVSLLEHFGPKRIWITLDMLLSAMRAQRAEIRTGDFLLLHTGFDDALLSMNKVPDPDVVNQSGAVLDGRDGDLLEWVARSGLVALCSDNMAVEGFGYPDAESHGHTMLPLHEMCLFKQGLFLGELWRLGELSRWMLQHGRHACLLTAPPLRLPGAVGSPLTPIATI
jgi:kynurenine formamidase